MGKEPKVEEKKAATTLQEDVQAIIRLEVENAMKGVLDQLAKAVGAKQTGLDQLGAAYLRAIKGSRDAVKNAQNPHLKNMYADLGSVLDAVRPAFEAADLWLMQCPGEITVKGDGYDPYIALHGLLLHASGQSIQYKMELPAYSFESKKNGGGKIINPQTAGSAISYARRYMWAAVAGITQVDDDADAASYNDGAEGPSVRRDNSSPANSTPSSDEAAEMLATLKGVKSAAELKTHRDRAQELANKYPKAGIFEAYMAQYNKFK